MPEFSYIAKQGPQRNVEGTVEAETIEQAVSLITQMGYVPVDVTPKGSRAAEALRLPVLFEGRVSSMDLTLFTRQLCDLIDSGVPMLRALKMIHKQTRQPGLAAIVEEIANRVQDGKSLSEALEDHPDVFPKYYVNMVYSGELGGSLDTVLNRLADFMERDQEARGQILTSLMYPCIILAVAVLTIAGLFMFVIPRVIVLLEDLDQALPWPTVVIMSVSYFFQKYWWALAGIVGAAAWFFDRAARTVQGRVALDRMILKLPLWGRFITTAEVGRMARSLGTLLENGVVIVPALDAVSMIVGNRVLQEGIKQASADVARGSSLTIALQAIPEFPEEAVGIIAVGEETGELPRSLYKLADYYERQSQRFMKRMTSLIEPLLIIGLGLIVGFIFVGMLLPILRMNLMIK